MKTATKTVFRSAIQNDCNTIAQLFRIASDGVSDYLWSTLVDQYPGLTLLEIGAKRYADPDSLFSYKNCVLAKQNDRTIGLMLTFSTEDSEANASSEAVSSEAVSSLIVSPDVPPESLGSPGTWYVEHHALFPQLQPARTVEKAELEKAKPEKAKPPTHISADLSEPDVLAPYSLEAAGTWYICALALFPEFQGQGIGTQFLQLAHRQAAERGFSELSLLCFEQNAGALRLYQRNGFKVIDRAPVVSHPLIHHTGDILLMTAPVHV